MASLHQEARLGAASLHLPANPITGARVAQYEREDSLESLVEVALSAAMEEEQKKGMWQMRPSAGCHSFPGKDEEVTFEDTMSFSDIYHSDEEYFRKLKDLKAAHVETMAKLEKMYQDKLNIRDIQAELIREDSSRRSEKARMKEYWQELEEQDAKLQKRPMLFERVAQRNARMAAERCYSNTLKALGLSEEFVSEKGQSGKVSENITRQELRSCTSDKESSYGEERENEEENYLTDTSSQDSCKGNKDDIKGSGEENSRE
ncbi:protein FAM161A [Grammomys surdaster]|uniref:protein FAM161A n=1 Tax=Grammomys surdaster TaxID=491861 RepID=UPI0010A0BD8C|nr:protein FAM161A [Grammomys surdaster]